MILTVILRDKESKVIGDRQFVLSEKILTAKNIQKQFGKPFLKVVKSIGEMNVDEHIAFLTCGLKDTSPDEFKEILNENVGYSEIIEAVTELTLAIQYPGLTEEEREKKLRVQQEKATRMGVGYQE